MKSDEKLAVGPWRYLVCRVATHPHLPRTVPCHAGCLSVITNHTLLSPKKCPDFDNNLTIQSLCFHSRFQRTAPLACAQYIGLNVFPVFKEKLVCTEIRVVRKKPVLLVKFPHSSPSICCAYTHTQRLLSVKSWISLASFYESQFHD